VRAALITVSSSKAAGEGRDESGEELAALAGRLELEIVARELIADDRALIERRLRHWVGRCELVLTSGGTGMSPSDLTPEATRAVIEREAPGIAEAIRWAARAHSRHWMLGRGTAGTAGSTLIVNLPGSPAAVAQSAGAIADALPHALRLLAGQASAHT